jgi:hypothetical protein
VLASPSADLDMHFPVTLSDFRVTSSLHKENGFIHNEQQYDYCFNVSVTATLDADASGIAEWGYAYLDPNGKEPDAGIYLRGTPQVQIWDLSRVNVGAQVGSGGLYNNQKNPSKPTCVADNKLGEWNTFYIKMVGDRVTVDLNGERVVNSVILENYWDRSQPIFPVEQLELQAHGSKVYYRDIYVKRLK